MKRTTVQKLKLHRDTIRILNPSEARGIVGGRPAEPTSARCTERTCPGNPDYSDLACKQR